MEFSKDDNFVGEWKFDQMEGQGIRTYADGSKYTGNWTKGKRN
eukprot:CAMPEP_0184325238 /NCGR_PEP_ID=MMETSP1049-20130417/139432_1 /TAXON_ID=77928 /ORGANISM="Proteomonas sulcata, Strain CCMP704" /LENGTH=42 /DNA_ID= /DNA_START= /DNA_END= /DNA_ORIENTATION=